MTSIEELLPAIVGGSIGFALAQAVNLVRLVHWYCVKPRLVIGACERIQEEPVPLSEDRSDYADCTSYRFAITNNGKRVARGVKAMIVRIEFKSAGEFKQYSANTEQLPWTGREDGQSHTTLAPGARAYVSLGSYQDNQDVVIAHGGHLPEFWDFADQFESEASRFTVVAIDDDGSSAQRVFTIPRP